MEEKFKAMAELLVGFSTKVRQGDLVILEFFDVPARMIETLVSRVKKSGGHPVVWQKSWSVLRAILRNANEKEIDVIASAELDQMKAADVYISLKASMNARELRGISGNDIELFQRRWLEKVHYDERVHNTRWCLGKWPTKIAASAAGMSWPEFKEFFFKVCAGVNYREMSIAMDSLAQLIRETEHVRITGPGTDIHFRIDNIPVLKCTGERNIPDGEIFTAPVKESVNGKITYNVPSSYQGNLFENVSLRVESGRIVDADCEKGDTISLSRIFDMDEGARYFGEFALGLNPMITRPFNDPMFDEKMAGSIHLTPGNSYKVAFNGNQSGIHWDLVSNQTADWGGGDVIFDGKVVRSNGLFVIPELYQLNPENLVI